MTIKVILPLRNATKNTLRYQTEEEREDFPVPTIYIRQDAFPEGHRPSTIEVTIEGKD